MKYIPLLIEIEIDCGNCCADIKYRIQKTYTHDLVTIQKLCSFVDSVYMSGLRLRDFDFNLLGWTKLSKEYFDVLNPEERDFVHDTLALNASVTQQEEKKVYRKIFQW